MLTVVLFFLFEQSHFIYVQFLYYTYPHCTFSCFLSPHTRAANAADAAAVAVAAAVAAADAACS